MNAKTLARNSKALLNPRRNLNAKAERLQLLTWRQIWQDLAGPNGLSWQTIFIFVPIGCIAAGVYDHNRLGGSDAGWSMTTISGYLVGLVALLLLKAYGRTNRHKRSLTMLAGFIIVGITRGLIVYLVGVSFGLIPTSELVFRVLGSAFLFVWLCVGGSVVVTAAANYRAATAELTAELAFLDGTKTALSKNISTVSRQLQTRINDVLVPATQDLIAKLKSESKDSAAAAVSELKDMIDGVVRPLSHRVSKPSFIVEPSRNTEVPVSTLGEVLRGKVALGDVILPTFVASATVLTALPSAIITMSLEQSLAVAAVGWLSVFAFMFFARAFSKELFVPIWLACLLALSLPLLAGSGVMIGRWGSFLNIPDPVRYEFYALAASLSFWAFWFQVLELKRAGSLRQLSEVAEEQRQLVSAMRQEIWVLQRHLASTLHGPLQAALFAALIKIGQGSDIHEEQVTDLVKNLQKAMSQLAEDPGFDSRAFNDVWGELTDFWHGVCELEAEFDEDLPLRLAKSGPALRCALEVIRESVNNAVKHGEASQVRVCMQVQSNLLMLEIKNNGKPLEEGRVEGFGSELIREVTHKAQLVALPNNSDGFVTAMRAVIVLPSAV